VSASGLSRTVEANEPDSTPAPALATRVPPGKDREVAAVSKQLTRLGACNERGQTLVMVAVVLVVLLGMSAMAVDVGGILWSRGAEQNAADAAALAGVRQLPANTAAAQAVARTYATSNGFSDGVDGVTVTPEVSTTYNTNDTLTVTITRTVQPGLRAAVGAGIVNVPAAAVGIVAPTVAPCDIWPWGIEEDTLLYGTDGTVYNSGVDGLPYGKKVVLKVPQQYQVVPGDFLALRPGNSNGVSDYRNNIKHGACIDNVATIETEPGNMGNNTEKAVASDNDSAIKQCDPCYNQATQSPDSVYWEVNDDNPRYSDNGAGDWTDPSTGLNYTTRPFALGCPCDNACGNTGPPSSTAPFPQVVVPSTSRIGIVPILEAGTFSEAFGNHGHFTANIAGFAAFYLIGIQTEGSQDFVVGAFLKDVKVKAGKPVYGQPLNGPVGYFLWR
jgi:hypothetical protein